MPNLGVVPLQMGGEAAFTSKMMQKGIKKSLFEYGHHVLLQLLLRHALEILLLGHPRRQEDVAVLGLVFEFAGIGAVLLVGLAAGLNLAGFWFWIEALLVAGLLGVFHLDEDLVAG